MNRILAIALFVSVLAGCSKTTPAPAPCATGLTLCGSVCVDLQLDSAHCGRCETPCTGDTLCAAGVCKASCGIDRLLCETICVDYKTDSSNCGDCGIVCGGGTACVGGKCLVQCSAPDTRCPDATTGFCTDLSADNLNCGACGNDCATLGANFACDQGICQIQCTGGLSRCGSGAEGSCVDLSTVQHCGNCTVACDAGESCRIGLCTTAAPNPVCSALLLPGPALSPAAANPVAMGAGSFNVDADGSTDLIIADAPAAGGRLLLLEGRGDGTFAPPVVIPATVTSPSALGVGRFDADANDDLLVASSDGATTTLQPLYGAGAGLFTELADSALDAGGSPQAILLTDLNQDGALDLIVGDGAAQATGNLRVFLNTLDPVLFTPTGLFGVSQGTGNPRTYNQILDVGVGVRGLSVGDVRANGDLAPDLVVVWDPFQVSAGDPRCPTLTQPCWLGGEVLLNDGGGTLIRPTFNLVPTHQFVLQTPTVPAAPLSPVAVAVADLNADSLADWAVAHAAESAVTVVLAAWAVADHPENGWAGLSWVLNDVAEPRGLLLRDFDGDAYPELVTVNAAAGALYYSHNSGPDFGGVRFDPPIALPVGTSPVATALAPAVTAGPEYFFTADAGSGDVAATAALGVVAGQPVFQAPIRLEAGVGTSGVAVGHFGADGSPDVALTDVSSSRVELWLNPLAGGLPSAPIALPSTSAPVSIVAGAIDADANADLAVALEGTAQVALLWGAGDGTFSAPQYLAVGSQPEQVLVAALNADALPDLVTADMGSDEVTVLLNQGGRAFTAQSYPVGAGPRAVAALRLGAATCDSLVTANATAGTLSVLPCDAATPGHFLAAVTVPACPGARSLAAADFDADGVTDLAVACDAGLAVFHAPGDGTLGAGALFDSGGAPTSVSVGDVDGDGRPDLLASVAGKGGLTVLHGAASAPGYAIGFSPPTVFAIGGDPLSAVAANLFGHTDGRLDVCVAVANPMGALRGAGAAILESGCQP